MSFSTLTIETAPKKNPSAKTRTFSVQLLGYLIADALWDPGGDGSAERPVWLAYFGTERESHPFQANLRAGRRARSGGLRLELGRRLHRWTSQKVPSGVVTVAYLPELFHLEPVGPVSDQLRFIFAPPCWWLDQQAGDLAAEFGDDAPEVARAALFSAYLDRRTPLPILHDLRFHLQLYRAARASGWVYPLSQGRGAVLRGQGAEALGLDAPFACSVGGPELSEFLVQQTSFYHEEIRRGTTRIAAGRRLLP